ncbi:MAG TPA: hypothetical protein HPP56_09400 [Nitrospirae bacterium]|nr:hypothetical protein [Nitrospirota bacterium]
MEIIQSGENEITIKGFMTKVENYFNLKKVIKSLMEEGATNLTVKIPESVTMTSSIISLFLRAVNEDHIKLKVCVGKEELYRLLETLKLVKVFDVSYL